MRSIIFIVIIRPMLSFHIQQYMNDSIEDSGDSFHSSGQFLKPKVSEALNPK